jgi:hypothetical protein
MLHTRKLKSDRSIGGWIVPLIMIALFCISLIIFGYWIGLHILSILIWIYAAYSLFVFIRTGKTEHLVLCVFQIFLGWISYQLPAYVSSGRVVSKDFVLAAMLGLICFGVLIIYLLANRRLKWRGSEIFEMAAETVENNGNGYTSRPRPIGRVEFSRQELLAFTRFCAKNLIAVTYTSPVQVILVPVRMGQEYTYLFRTGGTNPDSTWIVFNFDGDVAVHISQKDYLNFLEPLSFDDLCESLGHLFIEFALLYQRGEGVRIIDRMNAIRMSILE